MEHMGFSFDNGVLFVDDTLKETHGYSYQAAVFPNGVRAVAALLFCVALSFQFMTITAWSRRDVLLGTVVWERKWCARVSVSCVVYKRVCVHMLQELHIAAHSLATHFTDSKKL